MGETGAGLVPKGIRRLRAVEASGPPADSGRIWNPIRILQSSRSVFPRAVLYKPVLEGLSASQQAVMGIGKRKQREESKRPATKLAKPPPDPNPVVVFVVRLLATATVTDDGIEFTNRASAQQHVLAVAHPVGFDLVRLGRKWDKNNRDV